MLITTHNNNIDLDYEIGQELYFCKENDGESYVIFKVKVDSLLISIPFTEKGEEDPNHYYVEILSNEMKNKPEESEDGEPNHYCFACESTLFRTQREAVNYCFEKLWQEKD